MSSMNRSPPTEEKPDNVAVNVAETAQKDFAYWEKLPVEKVLDELNSTKDGLSSETATERAERDGLNEIESHKEGSLSRFFSFLYVIYFYLSIITKILLV